MAGINNLPNFGKMRAQETQQQLKAADLKDEKPNGSSNEPKPEKTQYGNLDDLRRRGKPGDFSLCRYGMGNSQSYYVYWKDGDGKLHQTRVTEEEFKKLSGYNGQCFYPAG